MQAFDGIRVLDLTHVLAGPFATYQLAVLGADVIKIEGREQFDMNREIGAVARFNRAMMGSHFQSQGANKRAMTLNLKFDEGRAIFKELAKSADVIVENFRSGKLEALGLGYQDIQAVKPDIIYCSITGFGQTGPKRTHAAFDNTIQAFSGMMQQTGDTDEDPVLIGPPVLDYGTGAQAAFAIAAALLRRERTGKGQHLDVAMLDAALMLMTSGVINTHTTGKAPSRSRYARKPFASYGGYETEDGLLMIGACTPAQVQKLWRALGRPDLAEEIEGLRTPDMVTRAEQDEPILVEIFKTDTAEAWEEKLIAAGLPAAKVQSLKDALDSEQVASRQVVGQFASDHSRHGHLKPSVAAFSCSEDGPAVHGTPPTLGEHTRSVLTEAGYSEATIDDLAARGVV
ncbi:MAG: CoA transferase [Pseudomonadota bacterium]